MAIQVEIVGKAQHPQLSWLRFVTAGKARSGVRRFVRQHRMARPDHRLGRKSMNKYLGRLPKPVTAKALKAGDEGAQDRRIRMFMIAIARKRVGRPSAAARPLEPDRRHVAPALSAQPTAISIKGLTPGVAYDLASCRHPIPGRQFCRPSPGGRKHRGPCHRLREARQRNRRRLARPRLGRPFGRRHRATECHPPDVAGALGEIAGTSAPRVPKSSIWLWSTATAAFTLSM